MASGGSPHGDQKTRNSNFDQRSNRRPPRYGPSFDTELSLNSEVQKSESSANSQPLPNNLTWTSGMAHVLQNGGFTRKAKSDSSEPPTRFTRKKHTPATLPRTRFSSTGYGAAQHRAMDRLKQHLSFSGEEDNIARENHVQPKRKTELPVKNERNQDSSHSRNQPNIQNGLNSDQQNENKDNTSQVDSDKIIDRLKQVRKYLKQATSLFIALNSKFTTPDEATDEDLDQLDKLAKLIKHLKTQEAAYVDFVQRSIAVHHESSINNTPSTSVLSLDGDNNIDTASEQTEDLEELRQQHALLSKMVEQQKQLKELQDRQDALLNLQRAAENQLKEAENEVVIQNRRPFDQKPENAKNQRPSASQPALVYESTGSVTPDNEAQALAMADAAQKRLELESRLMDLQAKKREMDNLVEQLQQLREMQLGKETALSQEKSINETTQNGEEDVSFTTRSAKDTGDNVDDEKILEALQLHRKLRNLQQVRDKLEKLKDLFGEQHGTFDAENQDLLRSILENQGVQVNNIDDSASESASVQDTEQAAAVPNGLSLPNLDWILNSGIDDPELIARLRQVKAAKERVANLKQFGGQNNVTSRLQPMSVDIASSSTQGAGDDEATVGETDNETSVSVSSSLMWQEDPEFQEKLRKLNTARKKLKKLQELVKRTEELPNGPNGEPYLPAELIDMTFSSGDEESQNIDIVIERSREDEQDETSETLVEDSAQSPTEQLESDVDTEVMYMDKLTQQREALSDLILERQKLLETQEQFKRLQSSDAGTQTKVSPSSKNLESFIRNRTETNGSKQDSATQTRSGNAGKQQQQQQQPEALPSNSLLWWELRRQRELQEEKLKKRRTKLMLEKKRGACGVDHSNSEGGGNSGEDEGFGRSTHSADITTATWGGSTQMSSTQNDSAVSSHGSDQEILVEVEDDASDGIVQAEEEEEEDDGHDDGAASDNEMFPSVPVRRKRSREKTRNTKQNATEKRLLFEGLRKRDLEQHERFKGWQNSLFSSGIKKNSKKRERYVTSQDVIDDEEDRYNRERSMWERQFTLQQSQLENTTTLCNTLLRDQQTLISVLLNRTDDPARRVGNNRGASPFSQYQQRQQEAFQGIQTYFQQQRFLVQQQQMLQNLTECYSQMQQQHEDMLHLQRSFSQLFPQPTTASRSDVNQVYTHASPLASNNPYAFQFKPEPVRQTPPSSPFVTKASSAERGRSTPGTSQSHSYSFGSSSWPTVIENKEFRFVGSTNPETGVPSPPNKTTTQHQHFPATVKPVSARVVSAPPSTSRNIGNVAEYNSSLYAEKSDNVVGSNVVVGKKFPTPLRASAAAQLAEQDQSSWRANKRRRDDAFPDKMETESMSSHQSSLPGDSEKPGTESDAQSEYSLFEALRDSIYSEVATLISQNESRPHFLIELFRELQLLTSDYLRQRALYSLRDLVTRFLKDDPPGGNFVSTTMNGNFAWVESASEQTPSESAAGFSETDNDQIKVPEVSTQGIYDYVEAVESGSTLSTPNSTGHEPFASEFLGETVIHLDKALKSVRERRDSEARSVDTDDKAGVQSEEITSSAGDVASESSLPDIQYPKIDTQALDRQIKKIMAEVIPCLNDHMEDMCSVELLEYIRKMVMGMIQQKHEAREFSRFFHKQLESILQDSLAKFIGKRMKDCGEDLLVDISEILFNELAFFKLMQELDGGASKSKIFSRQQKYVVSDSKTADDDEDVGATIDSTVKKDDEDDNVADDQSEVDIPIEIEKEEKEDIKEEDGDSSGSSSWQLIEGKQEAKDSTISREQLEQDEEILGRERDDAMAEEFDEPASHGEETVTESSQHIKTVELSVSESRPLASNGSGEEDESELDDEIGESCEENSENAEGVTWSGNASNNSSLHQQSGSQMTVNLSSSSQQASNQEKQEEEQDDDLPTTFTGLTEADLQAKIAEEQSRTGGIRGIAITINDGEEIVGDAYSTPEPESAAQLVNGSMDESDQRES